jgi:hypothetical protein
MEMPPKPDEGAAQDLVQAAIAMPESSVKQLRVEERLRDLPEETRQELLRVFQAVEEHPEMGQFMAGVRGTAQGLTFGFSDEIVAGLSAGAKSFLQDRDFQEVYAAEVEKARRADIAAETLHPGTFGTTRAGGAIASTFVPGSLGARGAQTGKGFTAGLGGLARGTAAATAAAAGETEAGFGTEEFKRDISIGAGLGGGVQALANVAGPFGRIIAKHSPQVAKGLSTAFIGEKLSGTAVQFTKNTAKAMAKHIGGKHPAVAKAVTKAAESAKSGGAAFLNMLAESFEKRGGAGLVTMHTILMQDPAYQQFIERGE